MSHPHRMTTMLQVGLATPIRGRRQPNPIPPPPFGPADLSGLVNWLKADAGIASADGDPLAVWADQSGEARDASQATSARRTVYRAAGGPNGLPAVQFDSTQTQWMAVAGGLSLTDHSIFLLCKPMDDGGGSTYRVLGDVSDGYYFLGVVPPGAGAAYAYYVYYYNGDNPNTTNQSAFGTWQVLESHRDGTDWTPACDGLPLSQPLTVGGGAVEMANLGSVQNGFGHCFHGFITELIVYDRHLNDAEIAQVRAYLRTRSGIRALEPAVTVVTGSPSGVGGDTANGFPGLVKLANGDLLVNYRNGLAQSNHGRIYTQRSADGGATWSAPALILDTSLDVNWWTNVGMTQLASGKILMPVIKCLDDNTVINSYLLESTDDGVTWSAPGTPLNVPTGYTRNYPYGRILEMTPGGTLLMPNCSIKTATGYNDILLMQSVDGGATWSLRGTIAAGSSGYEPTETALAFQSDTNHIVAVFRDDPSASVKAVYSTDAGLTWGGSPVALNNRGCVSPDMIYLSDGSLLLVYGTRSGGPDGDAALISTDQGATWKKPPFSFVSNGLSASSTNDGYPACVELSAGTVGVAYYHGPNISNTDIMFKVIQRADLPPA